MVLEGLRLRRRIRMDFVDTVRKQYSFNHAARASFERNCYEFVVGDKSVSGLSLDGFLDNLKAGFSDNFGGSCDIDFATVSASGNGALINVGNVLSHLPASDVVSAFGVNALLWAWLRCTSMSVAQDLLNSIHRIAGRDVVLLERARRGMWHFASSDFCVATLLKSYRIMSDKSLVSTVDLSSVLEKTAVQGVSFSSKRKQKYSLVPLSIDFCSENGYAAQYRWKEVVPGKIFAVYLDTPLGVCLRYKDLPNAVVGYFPSDRNTLLIHQLQGVRGLGRGADGRFELKWHARGLPVIYFRHTLVECVAEIASYVGFSRLGIQSGHNNRWTREKNNNESYHLSLERALEIYDGTAAQLGFQQADDKNGYKDVEQMMSV